MVCGDAARRICELARAKPFDLIVMPTHAGRFRRMLLGSTTAKVLDEADCLVMTTQHAETIAPRPLEHREWVCAIGLTADSERVLRYAAEVAATVHANLSIIHAIPRDLGLPVQLDLEEEVQSAERRECGAALTNCRGWSVPGLARSSLSVLLKRLYSRRRDGWGLMRSSSEGALSLEPSAGHGIFPMR